MKVRTIIPGDRRRVLFWGEITEKGRNDLLFTISRQPLCQQGQKRRKNKKR